MGPLLFLAFITDLPESVTSNARLFADDCLLYCVVNNNADQLQLQEDLHQLEKWEKTWQMSFNADKCFTLHISKKRKPTEYNYLLHNQMLEVTKNSKYLGVTISNDLSWANHSSNNKTLNARLLARVIMGCITIWMSIPYLAIKA